MSRRTGRNRPTPSQPPAQQKPSAVSVRQVSIGPIPDARSIEAYRAVRPDLPDLIIATWQADAQHRRDMGNADAAVKQRLACVEIAKMVVISVFALGMLGLAGFLAYKGEYRYAVTIVVSPIIIGIIDALRHPK